MLRRSLKALDGGSENLLTVAQVAQKLNVSTATLYKIVDRGDIEHVRVSNSIRFTPAAIAKYLGGGK